MDTEQKLAAMDTAQYFEKGWRLFFNMFSNNKNMFDLNCDGKIPISEVKNMAIAMDLARSVPTDEKVKVLTKQLDRDGDGYIDFEDFCHFCRGNR